MKKIIPAVFFQKKLSSVKEASNPDYSQISGFLVQAIVL
jgi:hypothetical protein